jgi:citrate lyase subunit beta/citryl-CoA lyase
VCDARAAGVGAIWDSAFADVRDIAALESDTTLGSRLGYTGRMVIHPRQVPIVNRIYTPTWDAVRRSSELVAAFEAAEAEGRAALEYHGKLIDYAMVKSAKELLRRAGEFGVTGNSRDIDLGHPPRRSGDLG